MFIDSSYYKMEGHDNLNTNDTGESCSSFRCMLGLSRGFPRFRHLVGIVMLVGIVVNNGIVLVDYTKLLVGRGAPVRQACIDAGESRLRPVLMTTLTTVLGLIPMAFFPGKSATMLQPIGLTVIGGLLSSTVMTLFFVLVLYSFINEHRGVREHRGKGRLPTAIVGKKQGGA